MSDDARLAEILELARTLVPLDVGTDLEADTSLEGIIDSFIIIEFITEVDVVLGIEVDLERVEAEDFESVRAIARMVSRFR